MQYYSATVYLILIADDSVLNYLDLLKKTWMIMSQKSLVINLKIGVHVFPILF
jgi:hypothetical protein